MNKSTFGGKENYNPKTKMKVLRWSALALAGLLSINAQAQTVDEIIAKYVEALGGKSKISGITSIYKESDIEVKGNKASSVTYILNNKGYKMEMDMNGSKIIQCVTDKGGWSINPTMGQTSPQALPPDQVKAAQEQLSIEGPLVNYAAKGNTVELLGKEFVNGSSTFKIKVTTKDKVQIVVFINAINYYMMKAVTEATVNGQHVETTAVFSNYRKTDYGYVVPLTQELTLPQGAIMTITDTKVEINKKIDPAIFEKPSN